MAEKTIITMEDVNSNLIFAASVDYLNLSIRAINVMQNAGIEHIGQLIQKTEGDLLHTKNCGKKTIVELRTVLGEDHGLSLNTQIEGKPSDPEFLAILKGRQKEADVALGHAQMERFSGGRTVPDDSAAAAFKQGASQVVKNDLVTDILHSLTQGPAILPQPGKAAKQPVQKKPPGLQEVAALIAERSEQDIVKGFQQAGELLGTVAGLLPDPKFRKQLQKLVLKYQAPKQ
ncbi:MAG: DNA-directed RNA polymerase subunit alpha C-terminal domain-containing protein [Alphaproteobacteria bacterium]